jgi:hypothetical protein
MKTPARKRKNLPARFILSLALACLAPLPLGAADTQAAELERLFFTPAQRAEMQTGRALPSAARTQPGLPGEPDAPPAPVQFDGVLIRSDGKTTRWVDGKAQAGTAGIANMKPGQIRANGKLYEPYQVQRPQPDTDKEKEKEPTP